MKKEGFLSVDLGGSNLKICIFYEGWTPIIQEQIAFPISNDAQEEIEFCLGELTRIITDNNLIISGIGISCGASIDRGTGKIISWPNRPHWLGVNLENTFGEYFQLEVQLEDDANAATFAEYSLLSSSLKTANMLYVNIGTGVGCGFMFNGQLYRGSHGLAGELGHLEVVPEGIPCSCGKLGCLQMYVSGKLLKDNAPTEMINTCAATLATAISNLVLLLDVDQVILGGGVIQHHSSFFAILQKKILQKLDNRPQPFVQIRKGQLAQNAGAIGMYLLAKNQAIIPMSQI